MDRLRVWIYDYDTERLDYDGVYRGRWMAILGNQCQSSISLLKAHSAGKR